MELPAFSQLSCSLPSPRRYFARRAPDIDAWPGGNLDQLQDGHFVWWPILGSQDDSRGTYWEGFLGIKQKVFTCLYVYIDVDLKAWVRALSA